MRGPANATATLPPDALWPCPRHNDDDNDTDTAAVTPPASGRQAVDDADKAAAMPFPVAAVSFAPRGAPVLRGHADADAGAAAR